MGDVEKAEEVGKVEKVVEVVDIEKVDFDSLRSALPD